MRSRLPHEAHETVFGWVLEARRRARPGEGRADRRRRLDDGGQRRAAHDRAARQWRELSRDADAHGAGERRRDADAPRIWLGFDRKRKGKKLSNDDWKSPTDPDARIARMKDGTTHLAYKPEHAVDLDTGVDRRRADPCGRRRRYDDALADARRRPRAISTRDRPCAERGRALRPGRRQGLSRPRATEGAGRRRVEDAHRRTRAGQGLSALAWRRGGPARRLRQPGAVEIRDRARDHAPARRIGRAVASPTSSIAAACAGPGCADARTSTNAT